MVGSGCRLRALSGRDFSTADLGDMIRSCQGSAGVSGGFFLYSEPDIALPCRRGEPVGLLVDRGEVVSAPFYKRAALLQRRSGRFSIEAIGLMDCRMLIDEQPVPIQSLNQDNIEFSAFSRAYAATAPPWAGPRLYVTAKYARRMESADVIPTQGVLINLPLHSNLKSGDVVWRLNQQEDCIETAMAGGPFLLHSDLEKPFNLSAEEFAGLAPPITFSQDETFDQNLLPRMAVGLRSDGSLVFLAVDGREPNEAPGLRLRDCALILGELNCRIAMNLDGGSSKRMHVGGRQVDRSSTEVRVGTAFGKRVRPIHSAIVIL